MDLSVTMLVVLLKWLTWENKSDKEPMVLMLLVTLLLPLVKDLLLDQPLSFHCLFMVVSYTMLDYQNLIFHSRKLTSLLAFCSELCYHISSQHSLLDQSERLHSVWSNKLEDKSEKTLEFYKEQLNLITEHALEFQLEPH